MGAAAEVPKLNVGFVVVAAGVAAELELPKPTVPPKLAKGLEPAGAPKGDAGKDDAAAPKVIGAADVAAAAAAEPGVPGVPRRLGKPRMTLPVAGVAGIECCDGDSSSDASSPSSLRICFSAWRFMMSSC